MARERCLDSDLCRLEVAYFTDHDDVGIVAQKRAQCAREAQPDLWLDLDLVDALQMIFDRIFDRQNLFVAGVDFREGRVKRSCLTATCRPGDKYDTMRPRQQFPK